MSSEVDFFLNVVETSLFSNTPKTVEEALAHLKEKVKDEDRRNCEKIAQLVFFIFKAEYDSVLLDPLVHKVLSTLLSNTTVVDSSHRKLLYTEKNSSPLSKKTEKTFGTALFERLLPFVQGELIEKEIEIEKLSNREKELVIVIAGIASLYSFVQSNFTGPTPSFANKVIDSLSWPVKETKEVKELLELDGEEISPKVSNIHFLFLSVVALPLLNLRVNILSSTQGIKWWNIRVLFTHQRILSNKSSTIKDLCIHLFSTFDLNVPSFQSLSKEDRTRFWIEEFLFWEAFSNSELSRKALHKAREETGLEVSLTGVPGKRTKFQTFSTPQLVLSAKSGISNSNSTTSSKDATVPKEVEHEDDVLLPNPSLEMEGLENESLKESITSNLSVVQQIIILCMCLDVKNRNPSHGLTTEEMTPYIKRVHEHPNNWMVHTTCLLLKSRLESEQHRTSERAALQLQVLVDQFNDDHTTSPIPQRVNYSFSLPFPPLWELKRELGKRYLGLGVAASALQIFEELEMWEEIIDCYRIMDKTKKAEEIVRQEITKRPNSPLLYCLLGELTNDDQFYVKAWEISGNHFARAQRSIGRKAVDKQQWEKCIEAFELALAINPLYPSCWFSLGCAAMHLSQWDKALNAFSRVVQQDPEEGQAWNNMASVYVQQQKKPEAFRALQEALKHSRQNWRIWENFLIIGMDIMEYQQAIHAVEEILELKVEVDVKVLTMLCKVVTSDIKDASGTPGRELQKPLEKVLARIESKISNDPKLWHCFSSYYSSLGDKLKAIEYAEKEYRSSQKPGWEHDFKSFDVFADATLHLSESYLSEGSSNSIYSAKTKVRSLIKKSEENFSSTESFKRLQEMLLRIEAAEKK